MRVGERIEVRGALGMAREEREPNVEWKQRSDLHVTRQMWKKFWEGKLWEGSKTEVARQMATDSEECGRG